LVLDGEIEILRPDLPRGRFRSVLFDFDGTLSLIREGWPQVMIPMMVDVLRQTGTDESPEALSAAVEEFVMRLNGRQTIYQMMQLAEEVRRRGGTPLDPLAYKHRYHDLLMERIRGRLAALVSGAATAEEWTVPGSHALLDNLRRRGLTLYLASGTDLGFVRREADLLGLTPYFGEHVYGALDEYQKFSKQMIIDRILREHGLHGGELLGFGDGFVEIEEVKRVGGVAVAVASDEVNRRGVNAWKRARLVHAGADVAATRGRCSRLRRVFLGPLGRGLGGSAGRRAFGRRRLRLARRGLFAFRSRFFLVLDLRRGRRGSGLAHLGLAFLEQFDKRRLAAVAQAALVALDDARVAAGPVGEARAEVVEQLFQDGPVVGVIVVPRLDLGVGGGPQPRPRQPPGVQRAALRQGDQPLGERPHFLGLFQGGDDALVAEQGQRQVPHQRPAVRGVTAEFAAGFQVSHGKNPSMLIFPV
jgi:phosphoglycolate phosphatase-like HAD superfamily hydrolase